MRIYYIYKITNLINNKLYIGQTYQKKFTERFNRHISNSKCGHSEPLYCAIRKYGKENFKFEILICSLNEDDCNSLEEHFIKEFKSNTRQFGYNILPGGNQVRLTPESIEKMKKTIQAQYKAGRKSWNSGTKQIKEPVPKEIHRQNISKARIKYYSENTHVQAKKVMCIETGSIFDSASQAAKFFGHKSHSCITRVCRGERKHYKNLTFKYI